MTTTVQEPLHSGFDAASTAEDVIKGIDLTGKVAVVTGGYSGIGLETARVLRAAGAEVVVPARDTARAEAALKGIDGVEIETMDLLDPASIDAFAERFLASGRPLHILVNSAGVMATPLTRDARGYEVQFATNHLGHFQLVARLWPALRRAHGARVVSVSSWGHRFSPVLFDDPHFERGAYDRWIAYGQSKTANILFALGLDERGRADGIRAYSLHPGSIVDTNLKKYLAEEDLKAVGVLDADGRTVLDPQRQLKTVEQGAATSVWCATSPLLAETGGVYCENSDIAPPMSAQEGRDWSLTNRTPKPGVLAYAVDPAAADRLWELSERLTA
ncbi:oxidoreductase [Streptomyces sp. LN704]|uniref:oxidoreductase n=1 Tax=Streptomyces sp. LN704 TaxID=3112982 RepID=UPI00371961FA